MDGVEDEKGNQRGDSTRGAEGLHSGERDARRRGGDDHTCQGTPRDAGQRDSRSARRPREDDDRSGDRVGTTENARDATRGAEQHTPPHNHHHNQQHTRIRTTPSRGSLQPSWAGSEAGALITVHTTGLANNVLRRPGDVRCMMGAAGSSPAVIITVLSTDPLKSEKSHVELLCRARRWIPLNLRLRNELAHTPRLSRRTF